MLCKYFKYGSGFGIGQQAEDERVLKGTVGKT
jgi:hypothetical protein